MQNEQKKIMTAIEARKLAKGSLDGKSDEEVEQFIVHLDFLAEMFIKGVVARKETAYKKKD
jgi:hypothetical protein